MSFDSDRINRRLRVYLQDALLQQRAGWMPLLAVTLELGHSESEMRDWLQTPLSAPSEWLMSAASRLGIRGEVEITLFGPKLFLKNSQDSSG